MSRERLRRGGRGHGDADGVLCNAEKLRPETPSASVTTMPKSTDLSLIDNSALCRGCLLSLLWRLGVLGERLFAPWTRWIVNARFESSDGLLLIIAVDGGVLLAALPFILDFLGDRLFRA
jgi:hypothetical protein